jgi:hypothetical protein
MPAWIVVKSPEPDQSTVIVVAPAYDTARAISTHDVGIMSVFMAKPPIVTVYYPSYHMSVVIATYVNYGAHNTEIAAERGSIRMIC